jgi:hypothetical protein
MGQPHTSCTELGSLWRGLAKNVAPLQFFLTKFCYYNLPTGNELQCQESNYDDQYPTCHSPEESNDHVLCRHSPARRAWRSNLIQTLLKPLDKFLDPVLMDILQEGFLGFFSEEPIDSTLYPKCYQGLLKQQLAIGWNNFLSGNFSKEWRYLQQQYCVCHHCPMDYKQEQWLPKLPCTMWICIHDLWLAQNEDQHGCTSKAKSEANHYQTLPTIRALYLLKDSVLSDDQDIFYNNLDAHLLQPTCVLLASVTTHEGLISYSVRIAKLAALSQTKPITKYFTTI